MDLIKELTEEPISNHHSRSQIRTYSLQDSTELSFKLEPGDEYCMNGRVSENTPFPFLNEATVIGKQSSDDETMLDSSEERDNQNCLFHRLTGTYTFWHYTDYFNKGV